MPAHFRLNPDIDSRIANHLFNTSIRQRQHTKHSHWKTASIDDIALAATKDKIIGYSRHSISYAAFTLSPALAAIESMIEARLCRMKKCQHVQLLLIRINQRIVPINAISRSR
jgi:hypothetical protein